jgi:uncharacterized protein YyaL (SSP411 family)
MSAVQSLTGGGGWPMSVFLTPEVRPFYGGTYFPPVPAHGLPSFRPAASRASIGVARAARGPRAVAAQLVGQIAASSACCRRRRRADADALDTRSA